MTGTIEIGAVRDAADAVVMTAGSDAKARPNIARSARHCSS